jgi:hypothetical protein
MRSRYSAAIDAVRVEFIQAKTDMFWVELVNVNSEISPALVTNWDFLEWLQRENDGGI